MDDETETGGGRNRQTGCILALVILISLIAVPVLVDLSRAHRFHRNVDEVKAGMTHSEVIKIMGKPSEIYPPGTAGILFVNPNEEYVYGPFFDWSDLFQKDPPFVGLPLNFRLFGSTELDIVIEFDDTGRVIDKR